MEPSLTRELLCFELLLACCVLAFDISTFGQAWAYYGIDIIRDTNYSFNIEG